MHRHVSQFIVVMLLAVSSFALLQVSATLGSSIPRGDSPHATQIVRGYYAALNRFLAGGEIDEMSQYIAACVPWDAASPSSDEETLDQAITLLAFRSTFPNLKLGLVETSTAGDLVIVRTVAKTSEASMPYWLNDGAGPMYQPTVESFRVENEQIVEQWSSTRPPVMSHPLALPDVRFWLDRPARLTISELVLTASEPGTNYVSVAGPGLAIPQSGTFTVEGNGQLRIASWIDGTNALIPLGEVAIVSAGQILVISRGQAAIRQAGDQRSKILLMLLVPSGPEPRDREGNGGHERIETLGEVLSRQSNSPRSLWFGTARVLASSSIETKPGWLSIDLTQVIVPPGERLDIDELSFQIAILEPSSGNGPSALSGTRDYAIINTTNLTQVFAIVRACSLGSDPSKPANCAATGPSA